MLELFKAEFRQKWLQFIRYPIEAISLVFITTFVFYGLFLGVQYIGGPALEFGDRLDSIIVGYVLWNLIILIMTDIALSIQTEAQTGTLEQLFLSPFGAPFVFLVRGLASLTLRLAITSGIMVIIVFLSGATLALPPSLSLPLIAVLLSAYGLAFLIGSLALLFKRVSQLLSIFQFALLILLSLPTEKWIGWLKVVNWILPMAGGAGVMRNLMVWGEPLQLVSLCFALMNGIVYLLLGMWTFSFTENRVKMNGKLGGY